MTSRRPRVAIVNSHPIQYFAPFYAYLAKHADFDLTVLYLTDFSIRGEVDKGFGQKVVWDIDLLSGYQHKFVGPKARTLRPEGFLSLVTPALFNEIRRGDYDVVLVHGWAYAANLVAIAGALLSAKKVFMRGETHELLTRTGLKATLRNAFLRRLYRSCAAFLAIGTANKQHYMAFGVPEEKISIVPYAVDNARFMAQSAMSPQERQAIRAQWGVGDKTPVVLYASKLQQRKHPDSVVLAAQSLEADGADLAVVIAGSGDLEEKLRTMLKEGPRRSRMLGFINQSELPRVLGAADVFLLPSEEEPWGLIVNEAMCAGLPVIVGDKLGSARDLVRPGENGALVPAGDARAIAAALHPILQDAALRTAMSARSREIVSGWDYRKGLEGWKRALASAGLYS